MASKPRRMPVRYYWRWYREPYAWAGQGLIIRRQTGQPDAVLDVRLPLDQRRWRPCPWWDAETITRRCRTHHLRRMDPAEWGPLVPNPAWQLREGF